MTYRYSKTTGNFFPVGESYKDLPDDLEVVKDGEYEKAMSRGAYESFEIIDGVVHIIPRAPSIAHIWDSKSRIWVEDEALAKDLELYKMIGAKSAIIAALNAEIQRRFVLVNEQIGSNFKEQRDFLAFCGYPNAFRAPAERFGAWVASVWQAANVYNSEVMAGAKPMLTPAQAVDAMPAYPGE